MVEVSGRAAAERMAGSGIADSGTLTFALVFELAATALIVGRGGEEEVDRGAGDGGAREDE